MDKTDPKVIEISEKLIESMRRVQRIEPQWGAHDDVDFWSYLMWDAWGSGEVRGASNPAKLHYERETGKDIDTNLIQGRAIHACVLEPETEWKRYHRLPDGKDRRSKEYNAAVTEYGKEYVLRDKEYDAALGARDQLFAHTRISRLLNEGSAELSFAWRDPETGVPLKGRADWVNERLSTCFDLKSTGTASEDRFARVARDLNYPTQGVQYTEGLTECDIEIKHYTIVAVEVDPPYLPILYSISTKDMMIAYEHWRTLVERLAWCIEEEDWPGYPQHTHVLHMGNWWEAGIQHEIALMREQMT